MGTIDNLYEEFASLQDGEAQLRIVNMMAIDAADVVYDQLPVHAQAALGKAKQFWSGYLSEEELAKARAEAWQSLEGRSCDFKDRQVNLTRLVICSMYPAIDKDHHDMAWDAVVDFATSVGVSEHTLAESFRRHVSASSRKRPPPHS